MPIALSVCKNMHVPVCKACTVYALRFTNLHTNRVQLIRDHSV